MLENPKMLSSAINYSINKDAINYPFFMPIIYCSCLVGCKDLKADTKVAHMAHYR